jgi:T5SS/PEP-CTERM-associated repeat protein/autotransporter-associated beta strand protein
MHLLDVFSLVRSFRGQTPAHASALAAIVMICLLVIGASPARAQQCSGAVNCNVTSGTLVINTSPNTYTGTTTISSGATLDIVSGGALNGGGVLNNDGALSISANGVGNFSGGANIGTMAGSSSVTVSGAGATLNVSNAQTNFGTVGGSVSAMTISNGASVTTANDFIGFNSGSTASVTVTGAGSLWNETQSQIIGDNGATGSLTIANGATVNVANGVFIGNNAGGVGSVLVTGAGSTYNVLNGQGLFVDVRNVGSLTVANGGTVNATGGIGVDAFGLSNGGTINIGAAAGQTPVAPGTINDHGFGIDLNAVGSTIVFNHTSTNYTFSPIIFGAGSVVVDAGTTIFTGVNTYTGATTINGGTLEVDGSIASSVTVTVNTGGTLTGVGIVDPPVPAGSTTINSGGTLAPGSLANPTGTLTISSNLAFQSGAFYRVTLSGPNASSTHVGGTATLGGATVQALFAPGVYTKGESWNIMTAAGGTLGQFSGVSFIPPNFSATLSYPTDNVLLTLTGATLGSGLFLNTDQQSVAARLNNFFNAGGALSPAFSSIFGLSGPALASGLTQLSGETATGSQQTTFNAMGQFMGLLTDPFMQRNGSPSSTPGATGYAGEASAYAATKKTDAFAMFTKAPPAAPFEQRWSVWTAGFGGSQSTSGNAIVGSNDTTSRIAGTAVGADYLFSPNTIAGFALAGGGTSFSVANGGSGRSDLFQMGAYVRHTSGPAYVSATLAYGWQDITTNRTVTAAGFDQLRAEFNANAWSGRVEGGYRFVTPWSGGIGITPYAAAQFVTFDLPAYAEQAIVGTNNFALAYGARDPTDARTELGIRTDRSWAQSDGILTLRGRFAWAHDYDPDRSIAPTFQSLPGASFVVNGAAQASDSALTTASIEMKWRNNWSVAATFEGEFSSVTNSYAGKGVVRYQW